MSQQTSALWLIHVFRHTYTIFTQKKAQSWMKKKLALVWLDELRTNGQNDRIPIDSTPQTHTQTNRERLGKLGCLWCLLRVVIKRQLLTFIMTRAQSSYLCYCSLSLEQCESTFLSLTASRPSCHAHSVRSSTESLYIIQAVLSLIQGSTLELRWCSVSWKLNIFSISLVNPMCSRKIIFL